MLRIDSELAYNDRTTMNENDQNEIELTDDRYAELEEATAYARHLMDERTDIIRRPTNGGGTEIDSIEPADAEWVARDVARLTVDAEYRHEIDSEPAGKHPQEGIVHADVERHIVCLDGADREIVIQPLRVDTRPAEDEKSSKSEDAANDELQSELATPPTYSDE